MQELYLVLRTTITLLLCFIVKMFVSGCHALTSRVLLFIVYRMAIEIIRIYALYHIQYCT